jgi:hypothetical protein
MKRVITLAIMAGLLMTPSLSLAKSKRVQPTGSAVISAESAAVQSLKSRVDRLQAFFDSKPIAILKQNSAESPTGVAYSSNRFTVSSISFDVRRTSSIVTPYIGYIDLTYSTDDDLSCGDVTPGRDPQGFSTIDLLMSARSRNCFQPSLTITGSRREPMDARLIFAFQDGGWILKDAIRPAYGATEYTLLTAFSLIGGKLPQNDAWITALFGFD